MALPLCGQLVQGTASSSKSRKDPKTVAARKWCAWRWEHHLRRVPSGYVKIAIENDHRNSGFSH